MITLSVFHFGILILIILALLISGAQDSITIKKKKEFIEKQKEEIILLVKEKIELSDKLDMLEETLTRAGVNADVWNTEDKVNDA